MLRFPILLRPWRPLATNSITDASTVFRSPTCVWYSKNNGLCVCELSANTLLLLFFRFVFSRFSSEGPFGCAFGTTISNVSALARFCFFCFRDRLFMFFLLSFRCAFSKLSPVYKENNTFGIFEKYEKRVPKRPPMKWSVLYSKNNVFLLVVFLSATILKTQKTESFPFCGNTRVDFRNLARSGGLGRFTDPQKWTPDGNRCRL